MRKIIRIIYIFILVLIIFIVFAVVKISNGKKDDSIVLNIETTTTQKDEMTIVETKKRVISEQEKYENYLKTCETIKILCTSNINIDDLNISENLKQEYMLKNGLLSNYIYDKMDVYCYNKDYDDLIIELVKGYKIDQIPIKFVLDSEGKLDDIEFGEVYHYIDENGKFIHHPKIMDEEHFEKNIWIICHDEGAEFMDGEDNTWDEVALTDKFKSKYKMYESVLVDNSYSDLEYYDGTDYDKKVVVLKATYEDKVIIYSIKYSVDENMFLDDIDISVIP